MKITVVGAGYVGLSLSVLLSQNFSVIAYDIDDDIINLINEKKSPFKDKELEGYLVSKNLKLTATNDKSYAYKDADYIIIATPTNCNPESGQFDTSSVKGVINDIIMVPFDRYSHLEFPQV